MKKKIKSNSKQISHALHTVKICLFFLFIAVLSLQTGVYSQNVVVAISDNIQPRPERIRVSGTITDVSGEPLAGVNIFIPNTGTGTTTDTDGKYSVLVQKGHILRFTYIGYKQQEIRVTGQTTVNIQLKEDENTLQEVVVNAGYQKIEKRHLTGAVTTIKMDDIMLPGVSTIDKILEGHVPGMIFMQNSGQVGASPRLRIRGTSTVLGTQEPLWVLDGIILTDPVNVDASQINDLDFANLLGNAIGGLNPSDIEQIDVLKDAAATALYGARAANGVIVITTKKGKVGAPSVSYSYSGTFTQRPRYSDRGVNVMNASERIDLSKEIIEKRLNYPSVNSFVGYEDAIRKYYDGDINFATFQHTINRYIQTNTDWFDVLTQNSLSHNHNVNISGGTDNVRYYTSVGYTNDQGVLQKEWGKRYTTNMNLTANYKRFQIYFSLQGNVSDKTYTPHDVNLLSYAYNTSRAVPAYNEEGKLDFYKSYSGDGYYDFNILNDRDNTYDKIKSNGITFSGSLNYRLWHWLRAGMTFSYSADNTYRNTYHGEKSFYATALRRNSSDKDSMLPFGGELKKDDTRKNAYMVRGQIDFNKFMDASQRHQITVAMGAEISSTRYDGFSQTHRAYLPERGNIINEIDITQYPNLGIWMTSHKDALGTLREDLSNLASAFATVSYAYRNHYIFNANARIDGSNEFGSQANDKLLPIWSVSGRWNVSNNILKDVSWVNDLALHASMGIQGNIIRTASPLLVLEKGGMNTAFNKYESSIRYFPNRDLKWEKTNSYNIGLDFSFFDNRLSGTASYFFKQTKDAFLKKTISEINGISTYIVNKGILQNQGFELSFNFVPIQTGFSRDDFSWRFDPQIGQVFNQLINKAINNKEKSLHDELTYSDYLTGNMEIAGKPLNSFYSYKYAGLSPNDGRPMFYNIDEFEGEGNDQISNRLEYSKMTKDEVFQTVMEYSGTRVPVIQGGFLNTFTYKGFVLSFNLTYSLGSKVRLTKLYSHARSGTIAPQPIQNMRREFVDRWRVPGDETITDIPGLVSNAVYTQTVSPWWRTEPYSFAANIWDMYDNSNIRIVSGDYLKLQSFTFRYLFTEKLARKLSLKSAYVSLTGTNLFTIASKGLKGQDPSQSGSSSFTNLSVRPTYSMSLNVTF